MMESFVLFCIVVLFNTDARVVVILHQYYILSELAQHPRMRFCSGHESDHIPSCTVHCGIVKFSKSIVYH